jgi:Domain of Unknown Function (DUF1080)
MISESKQKSVKIKFVLASLLLLIMLVGGVVFFSVRQHSYTTGSPSVSSVGTKVTSTPTIIATPSPSSTPQPLFADDFTKANKGWSLGNTAGYTRTLSNNTLTLAATNHQLLTESLPTSVTFSDFMITITFTLMQASQSDSMGLYLRGDIYLDQDYRIDIYGNNTYAISKEYLDLNKYPQTQFLINPTSTSMLKPIGQQNTLTVIMKGPMLVLLLNGSVINTVTDQDYTSGQIALFVHNSDTSEEVEASFRSVIVYPAPEQVPSRR